jgi:hypothetical protein
LLGFRYAGLLAGLAYDAWLHAIFLGFVFGMIFAHALIILPAITGLSIPFHRYLYGPVLLMQLGLLMRIGGDLTNGLMLRRWGGLLNGLAILWFLLQVVFLAVQERLRQNQARSQPATQQQAAHGTE